MGPYGGDRGGAFSYARGVACRLNPSIAFSLNPHGENGCPREIGRGCAPVRPLNFRGLCVLRAPPGKSALVIGCTSCIVKSVRSRGSFLSSPLWTL